MRPRRRRFGPVLLNFDLYDSEGFAVVALKGEINFSHRETLSSVLKDIAIPGTSVVLDLTRVKFVDSAALSVVLRASLAFHRADGVLRLVVTDPAVLRVLELSGLSRSLLVFGTLGAALRAPVISVSTAAALATEPADHP